MTYCTPVSLNFHRVLPNNWISCSQIIIRSSSIPCAGALPSKITIFLSEFFPWKTNRAVIGRFSHSLCFSLFCPFPSEMRIVEISTLNTFYDNLNQFCWPCAWILTVLSHLLRRAIRAGFLFIIVVIFIFFIVIFQDDYCFFHRPKGMDFRIFSAKRCFAIFSAPRKLHPNWLPNFLKSLFNNNVKGK